MAALSHAFWPKGLGAAAPAKLRPATSPGVHAAAPPSGFIETALSRPSLSLASALGRPGFASPPAPPSPMPAPLSGLSLLGLPPPSAVVEAHAIPRRDITEMSPTTSLIAITCLLKIYANEPHARAVGSARRTAGSFCYS